jgi:hypothetical protein
MASAACIAASVDDACILATLPETGKAWLAGFVLMDSMKVKERGAEIVFAKRVTAPPGL